MIFEAARTFLRPIGCQRRGQSRRWRSDQGFWIIGVEFQPSGFDRGTYLNVGVCWLWTGQKYFSYDSGPYRVGHFDPFENAAQFKPLIEKKAALAAAHVLELRNRFQSIDKIAADLGSSAQNGNSWTLFHAAIAAGLAGWTTISSELFAKLAVIPPEYGWEIELRQRGLDLASCLDDASRFRRAVLEKVRTARALQKLPPLIEKGNEDDYARLLFR